MQKIKIIQFLPYFPPNKWWLETYAQELWFWREKKWYGNVINVVFDLWYFSKKDLDKSLILIPAREIIPNFPIPKFRKKEFRKALCEIKNFISSEIDESKRIIVTHTRFFTSSLFWWIFAKKNKLKRAHIEHGSDYVKLNSKLKELIARIYDRTIWKRVFRNSDQVIWISKACQKFANKFTKKEISVIYRWIGFKPKQRKKYNWKEVRIWFVGRLVKLKWVDLFIKAFAELYKNNNNLFLQIVWDGEEKKNLEKLIKDLKIYKAVNLLGFKDQRYLWESFFPKIDILVNPSYQEWLPTSVVEWLLAQCVVVATDVWWTSEISELKDLILVKKSNIKDLEEKLEYAIRNYKNYIWLSKKHIKTMFSWEKNIEDYYNLLKN